ncbi:MAG: DUF58 domain-containing protein [Chloroflexota bacterium]
MPVTHSVPKNPFGFDADFLRRLERLSVINRRPVGGALAGPRRSRQHGSSVEFADFRDYAPGDDLRRVDWNAYARLDRVFLRLYSAERMTTLTLIVDHSASMHFGEPQKALVAARLGAVLTYVSLGGFDRVAVLGVSGALGHYMEGRGGKASIPAVWRHLEMLMCQRAGDTDFGALRRLSRYRRGPGMTIVLSDFMSDSDWQGGLRALRAQGQEVAVVQVLAPEEIEPSVRGDWTLRDAETHGILETSVTARLLRRYQDELTSHTEALRGFCIHSGVTFARVRTDASLEHEVLRDLHGLGLLR